MVMCAGRGAPVALAVKEKLTTPFDMAPMVSHVWSLVGAKTPVRDCVAGSTACNWSDPAAADSVRLAGSTKAYGISITPMAESEMYTLPEPSTATPRGSPSPDDASVLTVCVEAFHSLIAPPATAM